MQGLLSRLRPTAWAGPLAVLALLVFAGTATAAEPPKIEPPVGAQVGRIGETVSLTIEGENLHELTAEGLPAGLEAPTQTEAEKKWTITGKLLGPAGKAKVKLTAKNSTGEPLEVEFEWTVHEALPTITAPAEEQTSTVGKPVVLIVKGSNLGSLTAKGLPAGVETIKRESDEEWKISGTPTAPRAATTVTLEAENKEGEPLSPVTAEFKWAIREAGPTIVKPADQTSIAGKAITTLVLEGTNLSELAQTELPAGLTLNKETETRWTISGTPTTAKGATVVTLTPKNKEHLAGAPVTFSWTVGTAEAPSKPIETPTPSPTPAPTPTPTIPSAGRLGTVPVQKQGRELFATFLCEVTSCKVTITATIKAGKSTFKVRSNMITILQGKKPRIPLRIKKQQRELIAAALKKHKKVTAALSASIDSSVGKQLTRALLVTVKR